MIQHGKEFDAKIINILRCKGTFRLIEKLFFNRKYNELLNGEASQYK